MDKSLSKNFYKHSIHMPNILKMFNIVNHKTNANQRPTMSFYFPRLQTESIKKMHRLSQGCLTLLFFIADTVLHTCFVICASVEVHSK